MANRAKVEITAEYNDQVSRKVQPTMRALDSLGNSVRNLAGAWGIAEIARFTLESSKLAAQNEVTSKSFERLALNAGTTATEELGKLRKAVGGTLSDLQLMQKVGAAVDAGLTFDQSRIALEFLRRYSIAYGKDFNQLVSTIFTGLQRGSTLMLDDAGIIVSASDQMFDGLNEVEKKSALVGEAIRQMSQKMENLPGITSDAVTETGKLAAQWERLNVAIGRIANGPVTEILRLMADGTETTADALKEQSFEDLLRQQQRLLQAGVNGNSGVPIGDGGRAFAQQQLELINKQLELIEKTRNLRAITQRDPLRQSGQTSTFYISEEQQKSIQKLIEAGRLHEAQIEATNARLKRQNDELERSKKLADEADRRMADYFKLDVSGDMRALRASAVGGPNTGFALDDDALLQRQTQYLDQLAIAEAQASGDRIDIIETEYAIRIREAQLAAIDIMASEEDVARMVAAIEAQKTADIKAETDRRAKLERQQEVREVLLVFTADASLVQSESDLAAYSVGLFVDSLSRVSTTIGTIVSGLEQITTGYQSGGFGGAAAAGAGFVVTTAMNMMAADAAKWKAEVERLNRELEDAEQITGAYARSLESLNIAQIQSQFRDVANSLPEQLGTFWDQIDWLQFVNFDDFTTTMGANFESLIDYGLGISHNTDNFNQAQALLVRTTFEQLNRMGEAIRRFNGDVFSFNQVMDDFQYAVRIDGIEDPTKKLSVLNNMLTELGVTIDETGILSGADLLSLKDQRQLTLTIKDIQEEITQYEIDSRQEQANILISAIESQAQDVENALLDAQEASKQSVLRSVSAIFDIQEIALRQSFVPQLIGARTDPIETARVIAEANREIELLRLAEEAATTARLAELRETFESTQNENNEITRMQIEAINSAAENTSLAFSQALSLEMGQLSGDFNTFLSLANSQSSEEIVGSLNASRFAMLDKLDQVEVTNRSELKATATTISVAVNASAEKITNAFTRINFDALQQIRDYTWAAQGHLWFIADYLRSNNGPSINLSTVEDHLAQMRAYEWAANYWLAQMAGDGTDRVINAINNPNWARNGVPSGGSSSGGSGGGDIVLKVEVNIDQVLGNIDADDARDLFKDHLEGLISESLNDGELRNSFNQLLGSLLRQRIPDTIRI